MPDFDPEHRIRRGEAAGRFRAGGSTDSASAADDAWSGSAAFERLARLGVAPGIAASAG